MEKDEFQNFLQETRQNLSDLHGLVLRQEDKDLLHEASVLCFDLCEDLVLSEDNEEYYLIDRKELDKF